jgi:hypothetical protein
MKQTVDYVSIHPSMKAGDIIEYQERIYAVQRFCSTSFQLVDCFVPVHEDKKHSEYNALVSEKDVTWISPYRKQSREEFNAGLKNHGPLSKSELCAKHLALLKARLEKAWLNVITDEQKQIHEAHHADNLISYIESLCKKVPNKLYSMCEEGITRCNINLDVSETGLTSGKSLDILWTVPNLDGIQRSSLNSYVVYLLKKRFPSNPEIDDESMWVADTLCKYFKNIFPHLEFHATPTNEGLPTVVMRVPVSHTLSIL